MNEFKEWFNYEASFKILIFAMVTYRTRTRRCWWRLGPSTPWYSR